MWTVCLNISVVCLLGAVIAAIILGRVKYKRGRLLDPAKVLFIGVILSAIALFIPMYHDAFENTDCGVIETVLISIHNMIRLFVVDGEFTFVTDSLVGMSPEIFHGYTVIFSILFVLAPALTFSFVLSFFKNISAYGKYVFHFFSEKYIFSELNEKSLALAKDLYDKKHNGRLFVFTDVSGNGDDQPSDLIECAKEIGAVCFKKDINSINFSFHFTGKERHFFAISEDYSKNISQSLKLVEKFKYRRNTNLYVFSTQVESEILLANAYDTSKEKNDPKKARKYWDREAEIKVHRVNEVRSLVLRTLYDQGFEKVFSSAYEENGVKKINAVVVGMGQHGTEMTKALSWFCQMDGYEVEINSFDRDKHAASKFTSLCPELMKYSGAANTEGDAKYKITIHSKMDVDRKEFDDIIEALPQTTYVFVALGSDEKNIATAVKLRSIFERLSYKPVIQAVVYNSEMKESLIGVKNFRGMPYDIDYIGDMKSSYSEEVIINSDLEKKAKDRHMKWGDERSFWQYDYNYKSSIASAIHYEMKKACKIPGIDKTPAERTEEELWGIRILEHRRWNAYTRSEGYVYCGTTDKSGRNDLAKMHNCLVPFGELPIKEQEKDDD